MISADRSLSLCTLSATFGVERHIIERAVREHSGFALMETELSYKPRNARGIHSFGTYLGGTGQINLVNGNLGW